MTEPTPQGPPPGAASRMKSLALWALVALNAVLALSLTGKLGFDNSAHAESVQGRISDYIMIPSRPLGLTQDVVYILDTDTAKITAVAYDPNSGLEFVAPLDLRRGR